MIQKVIFDFDDTITNNQLLDYMAFNIPFKKLGISTLTKTEIQKSRKKGLLAKDIILPHLKNHDSDKQKRFFLIRTEFLNSIKSADYLRPQKNLKVLLENLEQKKINCVICSSKKNKKIIIKFLEENKIIKYFKKIYVSSDLGFELDNRNKENRILIKRSLLHAVLKKEKKQMNKVIFVGNLEDMIVGKNLNVKFIYYQNSYLEKPNVKPITIVNNMIQLNNIINQMNNTK